ncbi:MAG: hypothetical protein K0R67_1041 [Paenibacillus sp.]|jgi:hypothetical protein|nr:hypothetical protein [Paenibacillus sp.]
MKLVGWLSKLLVSAILISSISVITTGYIVNSYITQLLKPYNLQISEKPFEISDFLVSLWGKSNILGQGEANPQSESASTSAQSSGETPSAGKEDSVAAWAQAGSSARTNSNQLQEQALVLSEEQFRTKKEQLSDEDKTIIFEALSRLPQEDMQTISVLVEDGITSEELVKVEKIVEQHLKPEEYKQLLTILQKYE